MTLLPDPFLREEPDGSAASSGPQTTKPRRPKVLLMLPASQQESMRILQGVAEHQSTNGPWDLYVEWNEEGFPNEAILESAAWDGLICRCTTASIVETCRARGVPMVDVLDGSKFAGVPKIRPDNIAIGHLAAEELHGLGYRHLYFCGYANREWSAERHEGFEEAASLLGVYAGALRTEHGTTLPPAQDEAIVRRLAGWITSLKKPAAIFAVHDLRGRHLLRAAALANAHVPDEIAIVGVNNDQQHCTITTPSLSSIALDSVKTGLEACRLLEALMQGQRVVQTDIRIEPLNVIHRFSTNALCIPDPALAAAVSIIRNEACTGITIREIMRRTSLSRGKLEHGFRRYLQRSPQAEIHRVQLLAIKKLLRETDLPLKEVASRTGFEYVAYLNTSFKRSVGVTPGSFRRMHQMTPNLAVLDTVD